MPDKWFLYIVENKFGHLYTGITKDVTRRFEEHSSDNKKAAKALRGKGPLILRFQCDAGNYQQALKLERETKKLARKAKLNIISAQQALPIPPLTE